MVREYGTKEVKVQEVYSLDFDFLNAEGYIKHLQSLLRYLHVFS